MSDIICHNDGKTMQPIQEKYSPKLVKYYTCEYNCPECGCARVVDDTGIV